MSELDVTLADGRTLHVYDEGDPNGVAVVVHHGTPASGRLTRRSTRTPGRAGSA